MYLAMKKLISVLLVFFCATSAFANTQTNNKIQIVTSFSILADMAKNIAGDKAEINTIIGRNSDAHAFEPTPKNVKQLAQADLLIINGLNFEPWLERLIQAAGFHDEVLVATNNVPVLHLSENELESHDQHADHHDEHNHGDIDPHAWQSLSNAIIYIDNITSALTQLDPENSAYYQANAIKYKDQIRALEKNIYEQIITIPISQRVILTSHDSFGYFGREYDIKFVSITGISSTAEPSAKRIAEISNTIKDQHVVAIFLENMTNNSILEQIAKATNSNIGGTLYSDALADDGSPASTYLGMMRWNAEQIMAAFQLND